MTEHEWTRQGHIGLSGRIAGAFINSKLTPLILIASLLLGMFAVFATPREEEPQIVVPMADVFIPFPGASPKEVEELVARPIERKITEIRGVEYVYSISQPGMAMFMVRFFVGEDIEKSLVDLYDKLMSNRDLFPHGVQDFMVKPRDINDVPIVTLTLWSERYDDFQLRRIADHFLEELKKIPNTSGGFIIGGRRREVRVELDPARLKSYAIAPMAILVAIEKANQSLPSGRFELGNREYLVEAGEFLETPEDLEGIVLGIHQGQPVYLRDVAKIVDGPEEPRSYVWSGTGPQGQSHGGPASALTDYPAVTVALAKKRGTNAVEVSRAILQKAKELQETLLLADVHIAVTRDYGHTANEKANELLKHLLYAIAAVVIFLGLALGFREAGVVSLAIPLTLALTLFVSYLIGYSINRVTLFALIFSIGILVDDAIVVVENIYRHLKITRQPHSQTAIAAVDEVGNPTILATFTVIAALLPMAFISGLMGPYMRPIPVNASVAMFFSLLVAFMIIPWFCHICYRRFSVAPAQPPSGESSRESWTSRFYQRLITPLLASRTRIFLVLSGVAVLLIGSLLLFFFRIVVVKMLPFDNKNELQVIIDMPEGTTLEETALATRALSDHLKTNPEVVSYQAYVGTASPFNFNGLVRRYFLRSTSNVADIQVNLAEKHDRRLQSHEIAKKLRTDLQTIGKRFGANIKVVEVPPGPPVQAVLVAEVYGPDDHQRTELSRKVRETFERTPGIVDVDDSIEADQTKFRFVVDKVKASLSGIASEEIVATLKMALEGETAGLAHIPGEKNPVEIRIQLPQAYRSGVNQLQQIYLRHSSGGMIPISELIHVREERENQSIYHKNLKNVTFVIGNVAGKEESPVYGILNIGKRLKDWVLPDGGQLTQYYARQPWSEEHPALKWDGEWQITYETFRDMGIAFGAALLLIYLLIVGQFQSFLIPLVIMSPIPLTLIGIIPGHWISGSYFTATSMIGFIALAGIIVRNSILLVDFILLEQKSGTPLHEAVIRAGTIRIRPILLTAAALMVGAFVIILDPIFQGLAISLLFGVFASTLLTLIVIPLLYSILAAGRS